MPLMITTWMSALRANLLREQIATQTLLLEYIYWHIPHSVTKGHYFSKKSMIKRFSKLKSFTLKWSRVLKIDKYHFLFHFSKHSICTKVVLSSPNLTDIDQDTKIDPFSIVFFVFHKALVPFRQI